VFIYEIVLIIPGEPGRPGDCRTVPVSRVPASHQINVSPASGLPQEFWGTYAETSTDGIYRKVPTPPGFGVVRDLDEYQLANQQTRPQAGTWVCICDIKQLMSTGHDASCVDHPAHRVSKS